MLSLGTIIFITYFSLNVILIIGIAIYIHCTGEYEGKKKFITSVWQRRGIYGQVLAHLYDTTTDLAVLVTWGQLAYDTINYISIDMVIMFWTSIGFHIAHRVISASLFLLAGRAKLDALLALLDFYMFKVIYQTLNCSRTEATDQQKLVQLLEAIFESLPQV